MSDPLARMIEAIALEIAAIRKRGGGTQVELRGGERVGQTEGLWLYRFVVLEDLHLRDDTPVRLISGQQDVSGVLVTFREGMLVVALEEDLGSEIAAARLLTDEAFLLERLKERLEKIQRREAQHGLSAAEKALGLAASHTADAEPHPLVLDDGRCNTDQVRAVRRSLGSDTTFIWGPPGTGKTTTIARIVEAHYRAGRSVLLVSNTNIAVDTALERVAERLEGEPDFHQGLVIRQGPIVKEELRRRFGSQVILEEVVARLSEGLRREKDELTREAAPLEVEERSLAAALHDLERLARGRSLLAARERARAQTAASIASRERGVAQHRGHAAKLASDLKRARTMGAIRRFLLGLNPERLERERMAADRQARVAAEAAEALRADLPKLDAELARLRSEVQTLESKTARYPPQREIQERLSTVRTRLGKIRERVGEIKRELSNLEQQVLARCRILATTVYRTYLSRNSSRCFDAVVIDDASMLMPPLVYYTAGLAKSSVTITGDFRQLPLIVMSDEALAEEWLKCDVFEKAGIPERVAKGQPTPHLVALGIQYRMREPICTLVNELFYPERPIRSDPAVRCHSDGFPLSDAPLLYVDTAPFHPWTAVRAGTYSRYNLFHALLIRNIILHLAETGFLPPAGTPNEAVGAVTPYASQARLIQALLDDRLQERAAGIAATVHRFQGNEKRVMLADLTDSFGARLDRFLRAIELGQDGARLLNVALSRARHHVILVGHFEFLRAKAPQDSFVLRLVDHFSEHGEALELDALLPLAERDWIDGLHRVLPASFDLPEGAAGAFTEGTFYPAFSQDLARARESIVVLSPFATVPGTARWIDLLRTARVRGLSVRIVTRPPQEFGGGSNDEVAELVRELRALGVTVDLRARMHEKVAIIDGRILWHGSLNILSHRDTSESMLRIESPAACRQLARYLSPPTGSLEQEARTFDIVGNPECPNCRGPTVWKEGRIGIWFACEDPGCAGKVDFHRRGPRRAAKKRTRPRTGSAVNRKSGSTHAAASIPCPELGCGGTLHLRSGRYGT